MRDAVIEARLEPDRCALVTLDEPNWTEEVPGPSTRPDPRKRGVILSEDGTAFSFIVVTGGGGNWVSWVDRISGWKELDPEERSDIAEELAEARRLLDGEVYFLAVAQARREKPLAQLRCPCCGYLTLMERAANETCPVCWWEDDGQDDPHADERWGGPNGSLTSFEARENFRTLGAKEARLTPHARPSTSDEL